MPTKKTNKHILELKFERPNVNHLIDDDDEVVRIYEMICELDFTKFYAKINEKGAPAYKPEVMLTVILMAIAEGINTSRGIERRCKKDIDYIYVTEYSAPDHSTIARFIKKYQNEVVDIGKQFVRESKRKGISRFKTFAIDGTKIESKTSYRHNYTEDQLDTLLFKIENQLKDCLNDIRKNDLEDDKKEAIEKKNIALQRKKEKLNSLKEELKERKKKIAKEHRDTHKINIEEPDARAMKDLGSGYNVQFVVDTDTGFIVNNDVSTDRADYGLFIKGVEETKAIIDPENEGYYIADSGYLTEETLDYINDNNIKAFINDTTYRTTTISVEDALTKGKRLNFDHYVFDKENNRYVCPNGKNLEEEKPGYYTCNDCEGCLLMELCFGRQKKKRMKRTTYQKKREAMMSNPDRKELMRKRKTVERSFGQMKWNLGYKRFKNMHLSGVRTETALIAFAMNIMIAIKLSYHLFDKNKLIKYFLDNLDKFLKSIENYPFYCQEDLK